jgi:hypothetical protein
MIAAYNSLSAKEVYDIEAERRENQKQKYGKIGGAKKAPTAQKPKKAPTAQKPKKAPTAQKPKKAPTAQKPTKATATRTPKKASTAKK